MPEPTASPVFFLAKDLAALDQEIIKIQEQIRETKLAAQEGTEQSSESWHDNYVFEEAQRQLKMLLNHLGGLSKARERATLVEPPVEPLAVEIGTTVTFRIEEEERTDTFSIGSYIVFDELRDVDFISYETPVASTLLGAKVGDVRVGQIAGSARSFLIISIKSAAPLLH
jgi:transcription elongation GreA/GreB family factor